MCDTKRRLFLQSAAALVGVAGVSGRNPQEGQASLHSVRVSSVMADTANAFLASLDAEQIAKLQMDFNDDERRNFHYVPIERKGLQLRYMTPYQRHLATALLAAGLSQSGFIKAVTIMSLEDVLKIAEKDSGEYRNPEKYHFSIFGKPSPKGTWGYRVEGHHVSQNYTVVDGEVIAAPSFFGSNPAEVRIGPRKGLYILAAEEEYGFAVLHSLNEELQSKAIVSSKAYPEILTSQNRKAALDGQPSGLSASQMKSNQYDSVRALVEVYARNLPDDLVRRRLEQMDRAGRDVHFVWAGGTQPGEPHYYRVQTPTFVIELDNTQDGANHIHSVWRDFTRDFGGDPLRAHYKDGHHHHHQQSA